MSLHARLAALERNAPAPTPPTVDEAQRDEMIARLLATVAARGPDATAAFLYSGGIGPATVDGLVRLSASLVGRGRRGDDLTERQRAMLTRAGVIPAGESGS